MKDILVRKLTSRKLLLAIAVFIAAIVAFITGETAERVTSLFVLAFDVLAYCYGEGLADSAERSNEK